MRFTALAPVCGAAAVLLAACGLPTTEPTTDPDPIPSVTNPGQGPSSSPSASEPPFTGPTVSVPSASVPSASVPSASVPPVAVPSSSPSTGTPTPTAAADQPVANRPGAFESVKVVASLYPVRRVGDTATVNLYIAAQDPNATFRLQDQLGDGDTETSSNEIFSVDGVRLVDPSAKKLYLPAVTADGQCVCTPDSGTLLDRSSSVWVTVTFAAPPAQLTAIDVAVPTLGTFSDVPLS